VRSGWWLLGLSFVAACVRVAPKPDAGATAQQGGPAIGDVVSFDYPSLDERSVSAPAFRGKPSVLVFLSSDGLAGQAEVTLVAALAKKSPAAANYAFVAVEEADRRELVVAFRHFFEEKMGVSFLGAMGDKDSLLGQGPFGDVRSLTVVVLDASGRVVLRRAGLVPGVDIARALGTM
jgi:hypothetical protein